MPRQVRLPGLDERKPGQPEKCSRIDMRVTPEEKAQLQQMARELGVSVAALLLGAVFGDLAGKEILNARRIKSTPGAAKR